MVEVDPYDPGSVPVKRTALGRFRHEAAATVLSRSGRAVVYSGDDERFEYVYKFVSDRPHDPSGRRRNFDLLDSGTLHVARFDDDGTGEWLPLRFGEGPLVPPAFSSQADVLIRTRAAGDALGATRMDRPEDIEANPATGTVYVALTNNTRRGVGSNPGTDAANPRANNRYGHVIELLEEAGNHAATRFRWEIFLLCGDPADPGTYFAGFDRSKVSPIANPDNIAFDRHGTLWISTDGQPASLGVNDAIHAVPTTGPERGWVKQFLSAVPGSEVASLAFTPNEHALFASIQHPGEGGSLAAPTSTWPEGPSGPARPSVIVVTSERGGPISG